MLFLRCVETEWRAVEMAGGRYCRSYIFSIRRGIFAADKKCCSQTSVQPTSVFKKEHCNVSHKRTLTHGLFKFYHKLNPVRTQSLEVLFHFLLFIPENYCLSLLQRIKKNIFSFYDGVCGIVTSRLLRGRKQSKTKLYKNKVIY